MERKFIFENDEYYHVYNRGTDGREIVTEYYDVLRFLQSLKSFNSRKPIGSIYEKSFSDEAELDEPEALVDVVAYCLNPNHFHLLLRQNIDKGISTFLHRIGGYTMYFNEKYKRKGSLFQGRFKAKHIESNDYLLHVSAYVNLNQRVHELGGSTSKLSKSSLEEYIGKVAKKLQICKTDIILDQFKNQKEYLDFCEDSLELMLEAKEEQKELRSLLIEE